MGEVDYSSTDTKMRERVNYIRGEGISISCDSCTKPHCCSMMVVVWPAEAAQIARHVRGLPKAERKRMTNRLLKWVNRWRLLPDRVRFSDSRWWEQKKSCPFLREGRCSVYDIRPGGCRYHYALGPDPTICAEDRPWILVQSQDMHNELALRIGALTCGPLPFLVCVYLGVGNISLEEISFTSDQTQRRGLEEMKEILGRRTS